MRVEMLNFREQVIFASTVVIGAVCRKKECSPSLLTADRPKPTVLTSNLTQLFAYSLGRIRVAQNTKHK